MRAPFLRYFSFASIFGLLACLPACWTGKTDKEQEKQSGLVVINVLSKREYDDCHIKGSINVPFETVQQYAQDFLDEDAQIVLYCSNYMCSSSGFSRKRLTTRGFKNVWVYEGGTAEWFQKGYPVVGPCKSSYLKNQMQAPKKREPYVLSAEDLLEKMNR